MSDANDRVEVVSLDEHRFQKAMQVMRTAGFSDVAEECRAHRNFFAATTNMLEKRKLKKGDDDE